MQTPLDEHAENRALYWASKLADTAEPPTQAEREEFHEWLLEDDPGNEQRLIDYGMILTLLEELGAEARVRPPERETRFWHLPWPFPLKAATAFAVLVCLTLGLLLAFNSPRLSRTYETGTGQKRTAEFKEGSVAHLNTRTQLRWLGQDESSRRVEMLAGEATFEVARDERRPFAVILEDSEIRVLGTRFNVYRKTDGRTIVTVFEGSVEVRGAASDAGQPIWVRRLKAGQQIEYLRSAPIAEPHETDTSLVSNWQSGTLQLPEEGAPLREVVAELSRYTDKKIVLTDPALAEIPVGGTFDTREVALTLERLARTVSLTMREESGAYVVEYPPGRADSEGGDVNAKP